MYIFSDSLKKEEQRKSLTQVKFCYLVLISLINSPNSNYFQLVVMIGIRKSLDFMFTQRELKILDDIMPETIKRAEDDEDSVPEVR